MRSFLITVALVLAPVAAQAQNPPSQPARQIDLSGPRVGMTYLSAATRELTRELGEDVGPVISQFGWQKERRFLSRPNGPTAVSEFVFLIGGADQGVFLPSVSWLVGGRTVEGIEVAVGPNLSVAGASLVVAAGVNFSAGDLNVPVNLAVVPSRSGTRVSLLAGFNMRRP